MIISHKYKFIFIKPEKVAGTSIEVALSKHCGEEDIIAKNSRYNPESDDTKYDQPGRNYLGTAYHQHITPEKIKENLGESLWEEYFKFSVVRNPWDRAVSYYFYTLPQKKISKENINSHLLNPKAYKYIIRKISVIIKKLLGMHASDFNSFIMSRNKDWTNTKFYFDEEGKPYCDFYLRYENIDNHYRKICEKIGIPYEELPKTKNKFRKEKRHYAQYYNNKTKNKIQSLCREVVDFFHFEYNE